MPDRPRFSPEQAAEAASERFGVSGSALELPSERDRNFRIAGANGAHHVLKIAPLAENRRTLEGQNAALEWIGSRAPDLPVPRVVPCHDGQGIDQLEGPDGVHLVRLLTYLPGIPLANVTPADPPLFRDLGQFLGKLNVALSGFQHPGAQQDLLWHPDRGLTVIEESLELLAPPRRELLGTLHGHLVESLADRLPRLRRSAIHGDANDHNVLVECSTDGNQIAGLIDFGDLLEAPTVADAANAAAYAMLGQSDPLATARALIAGFHDEFPLNEDELESCLDLARLRLAMSAAIAARQLAAEPDNEYLAVSQAAVWHALERLKSISIPWENLRLRHACGRTAVPHGDRLRSWLSQAAACPRIVRLDTAGPDEGSLAHEVGISMRAHEGDARSADEGIAPSQRPDKTVQLSTGEHGMDASSAQSNDTNDRSTVRYEVVDLSLTSPDLARCQDPVPLESLTQIVDRVRGTGIGVGRYGEPRLLYQGDLFGGERASGSGVDSRGPQDEVNGGPLDPVSSSSRHADGQARTIHLGVDLFAPAGAIVRAPCAGWVHSFQINQAPLDYGPTLILAHEPEPGLQFFTLYGHLAAESLAGWQVGQSVAACDVVARLGTPDENGGWPPHLHFQVIGDIGEWCGDFPGVASPDEAAFWLDLCPSPHRWLELPETTVAETGRSRNQLLEERRNSLGPSLSVSYREPLKIVRGRAQFLYDSVGRRYLDAVNNVPHVGHCHPRVVDAVARQAAVLNTNTRYLHDTIVEYSSRLAGLFPAPLQVVFLTCSGSEANELALRLARTHTGRRDVLVLDAAYHGNTSALVDLSPYKHDGAGGAGAPDWVHALGRPDPYRGQHRGSDAAAGYVADGQRTIDELVKDERAPAAVFAEAMMGCGGQIEPPPGYLQGLFRAVREAGGVCVADEVQVGFGRVGDAMWAFELQDVVPDIVTLGKPIGNGHPLAAVITTEEIAASFHNGMEYFNTFGGNPVSCAVGQAVLDVIEDEGLQENARLVGGRLKTGLEDLATRHRLIGDVRGRGLYLGAELVLCRDRRTPAPDHAQAVVERMKDRGILISTDGPDHNVLKIKPPLVFTAADADHLCRALNDILGETALQL